jgi:hypothetical protein
VDLCISLGLLIRSISVEIVVIDRCALLTGQSCREEEPLVSPSFFFSQGRSIDSTGKCLVDKFDSFSVWE